MSYGEKDAERFVFEDHSRSRSPYARDKARIIHSSAWRRLAAKTQVLSPTSGVDFARNRLTHSLEVAQIGSEIATSLGLEENIVEAACLAHDIGHPPFGHNGEKALDEWMQGHGGFEGNAQTLRVLTRLEPKHFNSQNKSVGLNLTRAMLDASCKYPWSLNEATAEFEIKPSSSPKFGYFEDDKTVFEWMREGAPEKLKSSEAQVMDLSDDIAYSVHDFEDAVVSGFIDPEILVSTSGHDILLQKIADWSGASFSTDRLAEAFTRISHTPTWLTSWQGSMKQHAQLKNFTSDMIGRFARGAIDLTLNKARDNNIARYGAKVHVPVYVQEEIAVLKGIVAAYVMSSGVRQPTYLRQRVLLIELLDTLWEKGAEHLDLQFKQDFETAANETQARRAIADQVASLTDQSAISWHTKLCLAPLV